MNKEEIVQRLGELKQEKKQLKKQLKELPSLEVGRWYKSKYRDWTYLLYLVSIDNGLDSCTAYGFVGDEWYSTKDINFDADQTPATDKEVETALIKEAKKRGFKEGVKLSNGNILRADWYWNDMSQHLNDYRSYIISNIHAVLHTFNNNNILHIHG